jgi:hypothetical protein
MILEGGRLGESMPLSDVIAAYNGTVTKTAAVA